MQVVLIGIGRTQLIAYSDGSCTLSVLPFLRVCQQDDVRAGGGAMDRRAARDYFSNFRYAPHASALHMGFMMNLHEVKHQCLDNGPEAVSEIARNAQKQWTAARAIIPLGLRNTPASSTCYLRMWGPRGS